MPGAAGPPPKNEPSATSLASGQQQRPILKGGNLDQRIEKSCCLCFSTTAFESVNWVLRDDGILKQINNSPLSKNEKHQFDMSQWEAIVPVDPAGEIPPGQAIRMSLARDGTDIFYKAPTQTDRDEWIKHFKRFDPKEKKKDQPGGLAFSPSLRSVRNDNLQDKLSRPAEDKPQEKGFELVKSGAQPSTSKTEMLLDKLIDTAIKHDIPGKISKMADQVKDQMDSVQRDHRDRGGKEAGSEFGGTPSGTTMSSYQKEIFGKVQEKASESQQKAAQVLQKAAESVRKAADNLQAQAETAYGNMQSGSKPDLSAPPEQVGATRSATRPAVLETFGVDPATTRSGAQPGGGRSGEMPAAPDIARSGTRPGEKTPSKQDELRPDSSTRSNRSLKELPDNGATRSKEMGGAPAGVTSQTQTLTPTEIRIEKLSQDASRIKNTMLAKAAELGETAQAQLVKLGSEIPQKLDNLKQHISDTLLDDTEGQKGVPGVKSFGTLQTGLGGMPGSVPKNGTAPAGGVQQPGAPVGVQGVPDVQMRSATSGGATGGAARTSLIQSGKASAATVTANPALVGRHQQTSIGLSQPPLLQQETTLARPVASQSKGQVGGAPQNGSAQPQSPGQGAQYQQAPGGPPSQYQQPGAAAQYQQPPGGAPNQYQQPGGAGATPYQAGTPGAYQQAPGGAQGAPNPFAQLSQPEGSPAAYGNQQGQYPPYGAQQGVPPGQPAPYQGSPSQIGFSQGQPAVPPGAYPYPPPPGQGYQQPPPGYAPGYQAPPGQPGYPPPGQQGYYPPPGYGPGQPGYPPTGQPVYQPPPGQQGYPPPQGQPVYQPPPPGYQGYPPQQPYPPQAPYQGGYQAPPPGGYPAPAQGGYPYQYPPNAALNPGQPYGPPPHATASYEQLSPNTNQYGQPLTRAASHESGLTPSRSQLSPAQTPSQGGGFDLHCTPGQPVPGQSPSFICATTPSGNDNLGGSTQGRSPVPPGGSPEDSTRRVKEPAERPDSDRTKNPQKDIPPSAPSPQRRSTSAEPPPIVVPEPKPEKKEGGGFLDRFRRRSSSKSAPPDKSQRAEASPAQVDEKVTAQRPSQSATAERKESASKEKSQKAAASSSNRKDSEVPVQPEKKPEVPSTSKPDKKEPEVPSSSKPDKKEPEVQSSSKPGKKEAEVASSSKPDKKQPDVTPAKKELLMPAPKTPDRGRDRSPASSRGGASSPASSTTKSPASSRDGKSPAGSEPEEEWSMEERVRRWVDQVIRTAIKESRKVGDPNPPIAVR